MSDKEVGPVIVGALVTELETGFWSYHLPTVLKKEIDNGYSMQVAPVEQISRWNNKEEMKLFDDECAILAHDSLPSYPIDEVASCIQGAMVQGKERHFDSSVYKFWRMK